MEAGDGNRTQRHNSFRQSNHADSAALTHVTHPFAPLSVVLRPNCAQRSRSKRFPIDRSCGDAGEPPVGCLPPWREGLTDADESARPRPFPEWRLRRTVVIPVPEPGEANLSQKV